MKSEISNLIIVIMIFFLKKKEIERREWKLCFTPTLSLQVASLIEAVSF